MKRVVVLLMLAACGVDISGTRSTTSGQPPNGLAGDAGVPDPGPSPDPGSGSGSGSVDPGPDAGTGQISARTFLHEAGVKECNEAYKCESDYPGTQSQFEDDWGTSVSNCYDIIDIDFEVSQTAAEVANGNVTYNADDAEQCLEGVSYGGCSTFWQNGPQFPDVCSQALVGSAKTGDDCVVDYDCASADCGNNNTCLAN